MSDPAHLPLVGREMLAHAYEMTARARDAREQLQAEYGTRVVTWVFEGHLVVGVVVELPSGSWEHRSFYPEDRVFTPITHTDIGQLWPYFRVHGARNYDNHNRKADGHE
jgi:hypothetical protein